MESLDQIKSQVSSSMLNEGGVAESVLSLKVQAPKAHLRADRNKDWGYSKKMQR